MCPASSAGEKNQSNKEDPRLADESLLVTGLFHKNQVNTLLSE
jgi:hypothetical protein